MDFPVLVEKDCRQEGILSEPCPRKYTKCAHLNIMCAIQVLLSLNILVPGAPLCESKEEAGDGTVGLVPSPGDCVLHSTVQYQSEPYPPSPANIAPQPI